MKQRFSSLDVKVICHELSNALTSLRVANIYDLASRIFLFKFAKPGNRQQLIVDSGFRCHLTDFNRTTAAAPSPFVARLRKYLKSRRVTSVSQVGTDRIIDIQFSDGQYRLFFEFYAAGNIVLTDKDLSILALFRVVSEEQEEIRVGVTYPLSSKQNYNGGPPLSSQRVTEALQKAVEKAAANAEVNTKTSKKKSADALRRALSLAFPEYPPLLLDHAFSVASFDTSLRPEQVLQDDALFEKLMVVLRAADDVTQNLTATDQTKGYIISKSTEQAASTSLSGEDPTQDPTRTARSLYDDFHPFRPQQFENRPGISILEFDGFNKTVDEFFSSIESQKLESRLTEREENAKRKLDAARKEHEKRIGALQHVQELHIRKAQAIEANLLRVEEAIAAVNGLIAQGMDWVEIARLIEMEQKRQNPVAQMIKLPLKLYENTVTMPLGEASFDDDLSDEGDETEEDDPASDDDVDQKEARKSRPAADERLSIDIDLALSPWANARQYYDQKKSAAVKEQKTIQSSSMALKSTEKKVQADLKKGLKQEKPTLRPARKQFWFEKFIFFISSDGYLVIGGKDAQQNELLYRKYLKKGDVYVHADLQGAASVIVKNRIASLDAPIPPSTLSQAGTLSVATSSAWDSKAVMAAWWVNSDQVSKTAPTGEYLTTGGFMIGGKKNYLPPAQLLFGFAVMFQISEESKAKHVKHRLQETSESVDKAIDGQDAADEVDQKEAYSAKGSEKNPESDKESIASTYESENESSSEDEDEQVQGSHSNPLQAIGQAPFDRVHSRDSAEIEEDVHDDGSNEDHEEQGEDHSTEELDTQEIGQDSAQHNKGEAKHDDATPKQEQGKGAANAEGGRGKRHLTARERRLQRKGQSLEGSQQSSAITSDAEQEVGSDLDHKPQPSTTKSKPTSTPKPHTQQPRGKRGKNKKLASKYTNQDASDRELAMRLLGSSAAAEKATIGAAAKAKREAEFQTQKQRRREQHDRAAHAEKERQNKKLMQGEERGGDDGGLEEELTPEEAAEMSALDALVGTPLPGDELLAAIPVCAPWSALGRYKYRAKLQPGSTKKGKAVKEILSRWTADGSDKRSVDEESADVERIWPRETELIRGWRDVEVVNTVPVGKVRVMMGGGGGDKGGGGKGKGKSGGVGRGGRGSKKRDR